MVEIKQTYRSEFKEVQILAKDAFDVLTGLLEYSQSIKSHNQYLSASLHSRNGSITLDTETKSTVSLSSFTLAELVRNEGKKSLTFRINPHDSVTIDPTGLYDLISKYE